MKEMVILNGMNIGQADDASEAMRVLYDFIREMYGYRFSDGRNEISVRVAAMEYYRNRQGMLESDSALMNLEHTEITAFGDEKHKVWLFDTDNLHTG